MANIMDKQKAFQIVLEDMLEHTIFNGTYDAVHGSEAFINGISTAMEYIAYNVSDEVGEKVSNQILTNIIASEEKAKKNISF